MAAAEDALLRILRQMRYLTFEFRCYCEDELQRGELVELIQPRNPPLNRLYLAYTARNIRMPRNRAVRDTLLKAKAQW
jgi:DNA-binding transcriptional LysR family regulator